MTDKARLVLLPEQIEALAHRRAWRYKYSSDPNHSHTYTFNRTCLLDFVADLFAAAPSLPEPDTAQELGMALYAMDGAVSYPRTFHRIGE